MSNIYASANQVLMYVGEPDDDFNGMSKDSGRAMQIIKDPEAKTDDFKDPCVSSFFDRPWFHRIWVVQEVSRSKFATVICGHGTVPWERFNAWPLRDYAGPAEHPRPGILMDTSNIPVTKAGLLHHLAQKRLAQCTDPRDKVIALLRLYSPEERAQWGDLVDYELPAEQLFISVAKRTLHHTNSLQLLSAVPNTMSILQLPSWIPDWSADIRGNIIILALGV
jgi:hypothetical protein